MTADTLQTTAERVERDRKAQGLPPKVADPAALRRIAGLVVPKAPMPGAKPRQRRAGRASA